MSEVEVSNPQKKHKRGHTIRLERGRYPIVSLPKDMARFAQREIEISPDGKNPFCWVIKVKPQEKEKCLAAAA